MTAARAPVSRLVALALLVLCPAAPAVPQPPSAQTIIDNELAFAGAVAERGTRTGFLEYLADSAVRLEPQPVPARAAVEAEPPPGAPLRWRPDLASIAAAGDFGWASGPFLAYATTTTEQPVAAGHYFTVWRRGASDAWRVLLDGGTTYPLDPARAAQRLEVTPRLRRAASTHGRAADCSSAWAALWVNRGRAAALKHYLADDARLLYAGLAPLDGRAAWLGGDPLRGAPLERLRAARTLTSERRDIEVAYGEYEIAARLDAPSRRYVFVLAWDVGHGCRLALEMLNAVR